MFGLPSLEPGLVNERKFVGAETDLPFALSVLDAMLLPDRWHGADHVNSVYFDTPGLSSLAEKDNGDNLKRKVRARWYGFPESLCGEVPVFLEIKCRVGSARRKARAETRAPAEFLRSGALSDPLWPELFAANAAALGDAVGPEWAPVCRIEYDRVRYNDLEGGSRVSVDCRIRAVPNEDAFPWSPPVVLDALVCEFKNRGGTPPRWAEALHRAGLRLRSFSKYGECMRRMSSGIP